MAETTDEVRRDIELTRERMSSTLSQLEQKMNLSQVVKDHPWPAIAMAVGAGILLSGSRADVKATAATLAATRGTSSRVGPVLDDLVAQLMTGVQQAFQARVEGWVDEIKGAIGAPAGGSNGMQQGGGSRQQFADVSYGGASATSGGGTGSGMGGGMSGATGGTGDLTSTGGAYGGAGATGGGGYGGSGGATGGGVAGGTHAGAGDTIDPSGTLGRAD